MTAVAISKTLIGEIEDILRASIRNKLATYNPEPASMPFHTRLLGESRLALYSFIHSINTNFGTSIFEPVALALASARFKVAKSQVDPGTTISKKAQDEIQSIMNGLGHKDSASDKLGEIQRIRKVATSGEMVTFKPTIIDLMFESDTGERYLFDLKTAKPNRGNIKEYKRTLLEWVATTFLDDPRRQVNTCLAIPYNPYEPKSYDRWTAKGILDPAHDLKVAGGFWNFIGGENAYEDLLGCFERVGIELKDEIDGYFREKFGR